MHQLSRQVVLSRTKADLTKGKSYLLFPIEFLVPRWPGTEPGALVDEFVESTAKTGWRHLSGCLKLNTKLADTISLYFNLCRKSYKKRIGRRLEHRSQRGGSPHANFMNARTQGTLPRIAPHGKCGAGKRRNRWEKKIRVKDHYYWEIEKPWIFSLAVTV
jgi:hypothetical protein